MNQFDSIRKKIIEPDDLRRLLAIWRFKDEKIVFTNGCFDVIHRGHVEYLAKSSQFRYKIDPWFKYRCISEKIERI